MNATTCRKAVLVVVGLALSALPALGQIKAPARWIDPQTGVAQRSILDEVNFETDTSVVATGFPTLACAAEAAKRDASIYYVVEGYADGRGGESHNFRLSEARAKAVADYLVYLGVPADHLRAVGMGKAGAPSDKITNFVNRKAIVIPHKGGLDGAVMDHLPLDGLPCGTRATVAIPGQVPTPAARIEINGQTFLINVNYARIRSDLRGEIRQALAEDRAVQAVVPDEPVSQRHSDLDDREDRGANRTAIPATGAMSRQPEHPDSSVSSGTRGDHGATGGYFEILGVSSNFKGTEQALGRVSAGNVFQAGEQSQLQVGFQGELGSYRRKLQGDLAFTMTQGPFHGTAFLSYASLSGVAVDSLAQVPAFTAIQGGARLGLTFPWMGIGLTYVTASSHLQSAAGVPQDPAGVLLGDLRFDWRMAQVRLWGGGAKQQDRNAVSQPLVGKGFGGGEIAWRVMPGAAVVVRGETLPVYEVLSYQGKAETRLSLGLRLGGATEFGATWIPVPASRLVFPF